MSANTYELLREHIGHKIVCVCYGKDGEDPDNIAIECETCCEVLFDLHKGEHYEKFVPENESGQPNGFVNKTNDLYIGECPPVDAGNVLKQIEDSIPPGPKVIVVSTPLPNPNPLFDEAKNAGLVGQVETWKAHPDKIPKKVFELKGDLSGIKLTAAGPPRAVTKAEFDREYLAEFLKTPDIRPLMDTPDLRARLKGHLAKTTPVAQDALMEAMATMEDAEFKKHAERCIEAAKPQTPKEFKEWIENIPLKPDGPIIGMSDKDFRDLATWTGDTGMFNNCPDCGVADPTNIDGRYDFDERLYTWWCKTCGYSETRAVDGLLVGMIAQADTPTKVRVPTGVYPDQSEKEVPIAFTEGALRKAAEDNPLRLFYVAQTKSLWAIREVPEDIIVSEPFLFNKRIETFSMGTLVKPNPVPDKCPKCGRNDLLLSVLPEKHDGNNFHCGNCQAFWKHNTINTPFGLQGTTTGRFSTTSPNYSNDPKEALPLHKVQDPVHKDEESGLWFFWDEVWADKLGPYDTEEECRAALAEYCRTHLQAKKED